MLRAMMRNEEVYPEAYKFKPERFEGCLDGEAAQQVDAVFGFGRRYGNKTHGLVYLTRS